MPLASLAYLVFLAPINMSESYLPRHTIFWALCLAVAIDLFGAPTRRAT